MDVSHDPGKIIEHISNVYELKNDHGSHDAYFDVFCEKHKAPNDHPCWSMLSTKYTKAAVDTVKDLLMEDGCMLKMGKRNHGSLHPNYKPKLDMTRELDANKPQ
jgi:hypothetical protein